MAFKMKGSPMQRNYGIGTSLKQSSKDLKDYLIDEKGFNQSDADKMITDGAYTVSDKGFLSWYKTKDEPAPDVNSPNKNYKNPQDYKVFNMGNKPTPWKNAKPDYIDLDGDGNKTESMKQAAMDKAPNKMYGRKKAAPKMHGKKKKY